MEKLYGESFLRDSSDKIVLFAIVIVPHFPSEKL